jgi:outer membrane protein assembly factor BamE (lipoprotein component of BamABCDE complex)
MPRSGRLRNSGARTSIGAIGGPAAASADVRPQVKGIEMGAGLEMGADTRVIKHAKSRDGLKDTRAAMRQAIGLRRLRHLSLAGLAALALTGCDLPVQVHGNLPDDDQLARIEPGKQGRTDIVNLLGPPSVRSNFQDDTWYYVGQKQTRFAFFAPDIKERNVLVLTFDRQDRLTGKKLYTMADARDIDPVDRETPTEGRDLSIVQQLLGNVGRFNNSGQDTRIGNPDPTR